jgi:hypothetical protein
MKLNRGSDVLALLGLANVRLAPVHVSVVETKPYMQTGSVGYLFYKCFAGNVGYLIP